MGERGRGSSLGRRVFLSIALTCLLVASVVAVGAILVFQSTFLAEEHEGLARECRAVALALDDAPDDASILSSLALGDKRVTLVAADGTVLYDSKADPATMGNHADRLEIALALRHGEGSSERKSGTLGHVSLYEAVRLRSGSVVRLSEERAGALAFIWQDALLVVGIVAVVVAAAWFVSRRLAEDITRPILAIDSSKEGAQAPYEELSPLVDRLNEQRARLIERMERVQDAADTRRDFTANVTHELKTPIASISVASEMIRDGIVQPEDLAEFGGRIYDDAQHLSLLVSDILMLSKLDESERNGDRDILGSIEDVDLLSVARDVVQRLTPRAADAGVCITVEGTRSVIRGNARLVDELVSNLCENSIRYNRVGGKVFVWVYPEAGSPCVRVADTGIGIPLADQDKVFERFYRVDKGRSREMGGTGLGLAIVKHAAAFHGARISLASKPGEGTSIAVVFPRS